MRRWPPTGSPATLFDVYLQSGPLVATVHLPVDLDPSVTPWIGEEVLVGMVVDPVFGFHQVVLLRFVL